MFKSSQVTRTLEKFLNSYGWFTVDPDDYLDTVIEPGAYVRFYDDETNKWGWGCYLGWYQDLSKSGETSPYFSEAYDGIERLVVQECIISDDTVTTRYNYVLPENTFDWYEAVNSELGMEAVA